MPNRTKKAGEPIIESKNVITGENPTRFVKAFYSNPSQYARERFLTDEEVARLLIALDNYHDENMADVFRLCIYTGARHGEVRSMRWQDFDRGADGRWLVPAAMSKNKEPIPKVLIPEAVEILNRRWETRRSDEWVFPSHRHDAKTPYMAEPKFAWRKISEAANLKDVRIHDLRRTLGSAMARDGKSLTMIGIALGHKSLQATKIYARLSDAALRDAMSSAVGRMLAATGRKKLPGSRESSPPDQ